MNKIKIVFFIPYLRGGGAEKITVMIANNLNREKFIPYIITHYDREIVYFNPKDDVNIISLNSRRGRQAFPKLLYYLLKIKPHIVFSAMPHFNSLAILASKFVPFKLHVVISEHNNPNIDNSNVVDRLIYKRLYPKASKIVAVSEGVKDELIKIGVPKEKIFKIYNFIDVDNIRQLCSEKIEHPWFNNKKYPIILSVGRLTKQKGYPYLLRAFKRVLNYIDCRLVIIGEGEEYSNLYKLAKELDIVEKFTILPFQKNPFVYMHNSDCFVLSSLWEGFGIVLVEAMACDVPVISTDCPYGPSEIILNKVNGILVPTGDELLLSDAIKEVLTNKTLKEYLTKNAKLRVSDFTAQKIIPQYENLFLELVHKINIH